MGESFSYLGILCPPCFYILLTHALCVCAHGEEAYLACYHFLNDLCFQPVMDCIALIDINFPEPGKKKKSLLTGRACWYKGYSLKQQLRHSRESLVLTATDLYTPPPFLSLSLSPSLWVCLSLRYNQAHLPVSVVSSRYLHAFSCECVFVLVLVCAVFR